MRIAAQSRWIRLREVGWGLIAGWQILGLLSEFVPIPLESRLLRITGRLLGIVGILLIAYGFERLMRLARAESRPTT